MTEDKLYLVRIKYRALQQSQSQQKLDNKKAYVGIDFSKELQRLVVVGCSYYFFGNNILIFLLLLT